MRLLPGLAQTKRPVAAGNSSPALLSCTVARAALSQAVSEPPNYRDGDAASLITTTTKHSDVSSTRARILCCRHRRHHVDGEEV
jgi:hypothetical protein